jgi:hypothetical protein
LDDVNKINNLAQAKKYLTSITPYETMAPALKCVEPELNSKALKP